MLIGLRAHASVLSVILLFALVCISAPAPAQSPVTVIRVNAGGPAYTDSAGNLWSADTGYTTGTVYSSTPAIAGTSDPALYNVGRYDGSPDPPTLQYSFTVPNGWYEVRLHFAEPGLLPGARVFDVQLEGTTVFANLDVAAEAGVLTALVKAATTQVVDGQMNVQFLHGPIQNPFIDAIEVVSSDAPTTPTGLLAVAKSGTQLNVSWAPSTDNTAVVGYRLERCQGAACTSFTQIATPSATSHVDSGLTPLTAYRYRVRAVDSDGNVSSYSNVAAAMTTVNGSFSTIRVNSGGPAYTDSAGNLWSADTGYTTGTVYSSTPAIAGTSDPALYNVGRYDASSAPPTLQYIFAVPNGGYEVRLHFAEPGLLPGARVFDVQLEGTTVFANLDVAAEAGVLTALIKTAVTQVADGYLNIQFLHGPIQNPFIDAIEVVQTATGDTQAPATPAGFSALPVSSTRVNLSWSAATDNVGVTAYRLERCQGAGCSNFAEITTLVGTAFNDTGLPPATTYRYRVRAVDAASNFSAYSSAVSSTTYTGVDSQAPSPPTGLIANAVSGTQMTLSWVASTDDTAVTQYRVERCEGIGCAGFSQIAVPTGVTHADSALGPGTVYRYRVRAVDAAFNASDYSTVVTATTPAGSGDTQPPSTPASLTAIAFSASQIDLDWPVSTDNVGVTGYSVERCNGVGCSNFSQIAALSTMAVYRDTGLVGGTTYRYRIRAKDADNNFSAYSMIATVTTTAGSGTAGGTTYQYDSFGRLKQVTVVPN